MNDFMYFFSNKKYSVKYAVVIKTNKKTFLNGVKASEKIFKSPLVLENHKIVQINAFMHFIEN